MDATAQRAKELFLELAGKVPAEEWENRLDALCAGDLALRERVKTLLRAHADPRSYLDQDAAGLTLDPGKPREASEGCGTVIGPYKLVEQIGEGGMGTVWMAQQTEPVKRLVALKLIKSGMDSRQVIARFEAERQALALMDHPNIAKVLDAGTVGVPATAGPDGAEDRLKAGLQLGRPYFVMELVKGVPITRYCDEHHLTPRQRLELFVPVCQAIQHAHQKGIIHRDLKPSNVLVALYDDKPVPKVIDFGVAKATGQQLTDHPLNTGFGTVVGTVEYMSPEQAGFNQLDIDTRSDIYSLGVLLYELLAGSTPFTRKDLAEAGLLEMLRVIREDEPSKPSTKLSSSDALPSLSANRGTEPARLTKLVRGELDWIVMKALEKDRVRRYETANGFAQDLLRYLVDEPVQACPPSAWYRLRKFARRNKGPVLAVSLVALALVGGVIGTTWGMLRATFAEAEAVREAGEKTAALRERTAALGEKETALATAKANEIQAMSAQADAQENLKDALAAVDQMLTRVADDKLMYVPQMEPIRRDLLLDALKFYRKFLNKQSADPVILREAAFAHRRVGRIHHELGQHEEAERAYRNALEMFDKLDPTAFADPAFLREMINCHIEFSWPLGFLGKNDECRKAIRRAVELAEKLDPKVPDNRVYILNARNYLASHLLSEEPHVAEKILKENLVLAEGAFNFEAAHRGLVTVFMFTGRLPQAEESARQALKYAEQMEAENPSANWVQAALAHDLLYLARVITSQRPKEAEELARRAVLILDKLATDFPYSPLNRKSLADALIEDARLLKQLGQTADAEKAYRRAIGVYEKLATNVPTQLAHRVELGRMLSNAGKKQEAEAEFRQVVTLSEQLEADFAGKPEHRRELAQSHSNVGWELGEARFHADAERLYGWALKHYLALVREHPETKEHQEELASLHKKIGHLHLWRTVRRKDADRSYQAALEIYEKLALQFPAVQAYLAREAECHILLGIVAHLEGRIQQAEQHLRKGNQLAEEVEKKLPSDEMLRVRLGQGYHRLAMVLRDAGSPPQEVEKSLIQSLAVLDKLVADVPNDNWYLSTLSITCRSLVEHYFRNGQTEEGQRLHQRAVEVLAKEIAPYHKAIKLQPRNPVAYKNLADVLSRQGKLDEAIAAYRKAIALEPNNANAFYGLVNTLVKKALQFREMKNAAGCVAVAAEYEAVAAEYETLKIAGAANMLYNAACIRALCASTIPEDPKTPAADAARLAREQADLAMPWLYKAVAAGFKNAQLMKQDKDLDALRDREDFKKLVADVEAKRPLNDRAWELATDPDPSLRDPTRAVQLAEKAVAELPKDANGWNTLGVARYRAGDYKGAVAALMKYRELRTNDAEWTNPFFLAMAHWKLDDKVEAARWYKLAVEWMEQKKANSEMMRQVRAEAAELLAVEMKQD